eukprot:Pgem_evm2s10353
MSSGYVIGVFEGSGCSGNNIGYMEMTMNQCYTCMNFVNSMQFVPNSAVNDNDNDNNNNNNDYTLNEFHDSKDCDSDPFFTYRAKFKECINFDDDGVSKSFYVLPGLDIP